MDYDHTISWFQTKIGTYDKANWERIVEKHEISLLPDLQKIQHLRSVRVRTDLIDVDLVRGSTFSKAKPAYHWTQVTKKGILRVLLFPIYWRWWHQQTSLILWMFFFALYFSQILSLGIYFSSQAGDMKYIPLTEAVSPIVIMILLGEVYIHVVSTNFTKPTNHLVKKKRKIRKEPGGRKKRKASKEESPVESIPQQNNVEKKQTWNSLRNRKIVEDRSDQREQTGSATSSPEVPGEERPEKLSSGRDSSTGDTSSGSDSSSDSSTSSISDEEQEVNEDINEDNPFETRTAGTLKPEEKMNLGERCPPTEETVMVSVWDGTTFKKVKMTLLEISSTIVQKVDAHHNKTDYFAAGIVFATFLSLLPLFYRIYMKSFPDTNVSLPGSWRAFHELIYKAFGSNWRLQMVIIISMISRFSLSFSFFFLLCVAERAYRMRYLYAKYFGALTSARKARRNCLPHFRLHKVRHIKTWLSLRSFLKKRGPQRSVDTIMSSSFLIGIVLVVITCVQFIKYNGTTDKDSYLSYYFNWEVTAWCLMIGIYLMRFLTLGAEINMKYRNNTVLLTEQINLYLQMEYTPHKKEELSIANNVLKLASKLLRELESPFKISGLIMNPLLSNITRVVVLSLFSGVMSDILGFRLKLWKIKAE